MISVKNKLSTIALACAAVGFSQFVLAEDGGTPTASPSTQPSAVAVQHRTPQEIMAEYGPIRTQVHALLTDDVLSNPQKRTGAAPKGIELLNQQYKLLGELMDTKAIPASSLQSGQQAITAKLYLLNDAPTAVSVKKMLASSDPGQQLDGKSIELLSQWFGAGNDHTVSNNIADQVEKLVHAHPDNSNVAMLTINLSQTTNDEAISNRMDTLIADEITSPTAKGAKAQIIAQRDAEKKQLAFKDKPLEIAAKTVDGKPFTTADWKGKVVLVDYWATWCGPCREGLPHVKEIYSQYHDKGLEIVGVSNDYTAKALMDFTPANNMPWPQLLDTDAAAKQEWNPITMDHGIRGIPTMWLIDKKGILRSITAREDMDTLIPKLLAE